MEGGQTLPSFLPRCPDGSCPALPTDADPVPRVSLPTADAILLGLLTRVSALL